MSSSVTDVSCGFCGVVFYKTLYKQSLSKTGIFFCSREHQGLASRRDNEVNYHTGSPSANIKTENIFLCKNCGKKQKVTKKFKNFCSDECKTSYIANLKEKKCSSCETVYDITDFSSVKASFDGKNSICKYCVNNRWSAWYLQKIEVNRKNNVAANMKFSKTDLGMEAAFQKRLKKYGLTEKLFLNLFEKFDGKCHCCKERIATDIDHDHQTGEVRGILCNSCNSGIGLLGDNLVGLQKALQYLVK